MDNLHCSVCGKALSGGLDTFGDVGFELCFEDYANPPDDDDPLIEAEREDAIDALMEEIAELEWELETVDEDELGEDEAALYEMELEADINDRELQLSILKTERARSKRLFEEFKQKRINHWKALVS